MLTRVQLNLLGRRSYLSSVVSLATGGAQATISLENNDDDSQEQEYGSDFEVNRKYLTFSWWLLNRGWVDIMQRVEGSVRQVFGHLSPRDSVTFDTFARLTHDTRRLIEGSSPGTGAGTRWLPFLLPPSNMEEFVLRESGVLDVSADPSYSSSPSLRRLLDETSDLVESPAFAQVLTQILDAGFANLLDKKLTAGAFDQHVPSVIDVTNNNAVATITNRAVLLPKVLSVLTRQAHIIGNGMPNEYLQAMEAVRDLEGFAAVVYSSNWQAEIARDAEPEHQQQQQQQQFPQTATPFYSAPPSIAAPRSVQGDDVVIQPRGRESQPQTQPETQKEIPTPAATTTSASVAPAGPELVAAESSSLVMVDPHQSQTESTLDIVQSHSEADSFDSAWERAFDKHQDRESVQQEQVEQVQDVQVEEQEQIQVEGLGQQEGGINKE